MIDEDTWLLNQAWMLASRLEKLSADSIWARRSSGVRGNLLRELDFARAGENSELNKTQREQLLSLLEIGFDYLERGAREKLGA